MIFSLRVFALGAWLAAGASAAFAGGPAWAHDMHEVEDTLMENERYVAIDDEPAPDFALHDPEGRSVRLADLRGRVVVLHFIYTTCPDVCPVHSDRLIAVQEEVKRAGLRDKVVFVAVSVDPIADTPERLRDYAVQRGADAANWLMLTSGPERPEATRALAAEYGLKVDEVEPGIFSHALVTYLIDGEGRLRGRYFGLDFEPENLLVHITALAHDD